MVKNYLKIVLRTMVRHKGYTFLNIAGLAIGIAVTALIMLYVKYEWEYDRFYPDTDSIYRIIQRQPGNIFMGTDYFAVTQEPLGRTMQSEYPEVKDYVTMSSWKEIVITVNGNRHFEENLLYATAPNLFKIFSFDFAKGDPETALSQLNTVVITENVAKKFFGNENPVGKTITVGGKHVWSVSGIFKQMPSNSQFSGFEIITSFDTYASTLGSKNSFKWGSSSWYTFLLLKNEADPKALEAKLPALVKKYMTNADGNTRPREYFLQPLKETHLYNKANFTMGIDGDIKTVLVLTAIAFVILIIACINYTNLSTARASLRAREVGVRKVIGAKKSQLISQFLGESIILSLIAGLIALVLDAIFLPSFFQLIGIDLGGTALLLPSFLIGFLLFVVLVGLLSGSYPAFVLSKYQPIRVLKGDKGKSGDRPSLRRVLVIIQFAASISLIACTFIILNQMNYIKTKNMGYNRDNIIVLKLNDASVIKKLEPMRQELEQNPSIVGVTATNHLPIDIGSETSASKEGEPEENSVQSYQLDADYEFIPTFSIPIVEGRKFSRDVSTDSSDAVLINQSLEKALGIKPAVGKTIQINSSKYNVIGVMKDFNMHSVHHKIQPLFVLMTGSYYGYLSIRIRPQNISSTISFINSVWDRIATQRSFKYTYLDTNFNLLYDDEERLAKVITYSSCLAIFIACLGLLGLVSFIVEQRRKEIGIRKVLGASVSDVVGTLSKQFIQLVLLANVIAWPAAYYFMNEWLSDFVYRIDISLWAFIISGGIALLIALATVSFQAIKAAFANPVESLRYE
jgi:putative ABC transport system permease protein